MPGTPSTFPNERRFIWLLCLLAAVHVFVFSAAFPFFNNVDEDAHFDLVAKYSHAQVAPDVSPRESIYFRAAYHSHAYFNQPQNFPGGQYPAPIWKQPSDVAPKVLAAREAIREFSVNQESSQPPVYYAVAGAWWKLCGALGLPEGDRLFALRFLNIAFIVLLLWLGYATAQIVAPENRFLRLGVPAVLAFMPQSVFYSINNDVLSPIAFGAVFFRLVRLLQTDVPDRSLAAMTGIAIAATFLVKMTNLPLLVVAFTVVVLKIRRLAVEKKLRPAVPALIALAFCAAVPIGAWTAVCRRHFGDFTGSKFKMEYFGWTYKPFGDWWHHPIFSLPGLWTYLRGQLSTFWQGELWWHGGPIGLPALDIFYTVISLVALTAAVVALRIRRPALLEREALAFAFICVAAALGFFAFMSVIYDFGACINPSRTFPYFHAGRMMLGMLIPFVLLFVYGWDRLFTRFGIKTRGLALALFIGFMLAGEIATDHAVFANEYNWYHLAAPAPAIPGPGQ